MKQVTTLLLGGINIEVSLTNVKLTLETTDVEALMMGNRLAAVHEATGDVSNLRAERNALLDRFAALLDGVKSNSRQDAGPTLNDDPPATEPLPPAKDGRHSQHAEIKARVEAATKLRDEGITMQQAADKLGVKRSTLKVNLRNAGVVWPRVHNGRVSKIDVDKMRGLAALGLTRHEIADRLGVSYSTVCDASTKHGIKVTRKSVKGRSGPRHVDVDIDQLRSFAEQGLSQKEIAAQMGISAPTVRGRAKANNIAIKDGRIDANGERGRTHGKLEVHTGSSGCNGHSIEDAVDIVRIYANSGKSIEECDQRLGVAGGTERIIRLYAPDVQFVGSRVAA